MSIDNMHKVLVMVGFVVFELCEWTDKQSNKQYSLQYLAPFLWQSNEWSLSITAPPHIHRNRRLLNRTLWEEESGNPEGLGRPGLDPVVDESTSEDEIGHPAAERLE